MRSPLGMLPAQSRWLRPITAQSALAVALGLSTLIHGGVSSADEPSREHAPSRAAAPAAARTDSFETKLRLLQAAWERGDYDVARSLTHSLRDTVLQTQHGEEAPDASVVPVSAWFRVDQLAPSLKAWARGWKHVKLVSVREPAGILRSAEPVEIALGFPEGQVTSLSREIRVARLDPDTGRPTEIPSQIYHDVRRGAERHGRILCQLDSRPGQEQLLAVFYGNPSAELPEYPSDLTTEGEGMALEIANSHFKAALSKQTGQLERLTLFREHGLELYSGGEGHGEPPGIDWAHDYVDAGGFQKLRISHWARCPDHEVIRGPLCTIVRRWGFPHSPVHPIDTPARLHVMVEYRFHAGQPWFHKIGSMKALASFRAEAMRDDEWVITGQPFTDTLWMGRDGRLKTGDVPAESLEDLWGVGFFNRQTRDSFMALFLEHVSSGIPELKHGGVPTLVYRWHGSLWSRYPLPVKDVPAGAVIRQKNAYVVTPFDPETSPSRLEQLRRALAQPLVVTAGPGRLPGVLAADPGGVATVHGTESLARAGEGPESTGRKEAVWAALRDCKDAQLYTADINIVELGLVRDVRIRGDVVTVTLVAPHPGRSRIHYFVHGSVSVHPTPSVPVRERLMKLPWVRQVVVKEARHPEWSSNELTADGRRKLGLELVPGR